MTVNYIVLVHNNPLQSKKLITTLNQKDAWFYVHVDQKTKIAPFQTLLQEIPNLTIVPNELREECNWGGVGVVKACLTIFRMIIKSGREGYSVLLSGQDYPIKSNTYITEYLKKFQGTDFITCFPLPSPNWSYGGMNRLSHYKIDLSSKRGDFIQLPSVWSREFYSYNSLKKILKLILRKKGRHLSKLFQKKKLPDYIRPYGGDAWWSLTTETSSDILKYLDLHPDLLHFMTCSNLSDEMIFQTIVMEIHKDNPSKIRKSVTYANWSGMDEPSPKTITPEDLGKIISLSPDLLFARKFDIIKYPKIFALIEDTDLEFKE